MDPAPQPLALLERWMRYTQVELIAVRSELLQQRAEEASARQIQQQQLDGLQRQVREQEQELSQIREFIVQQCRSFEVLQNRVVQLIQGVRDESSTFRGNSHPTG